MKSFLPLIKAEWRLLLFGFIMTFGSSLGQTYFIGLFGGDIRSDLGLSHGDFGGVYSAATLASAILLLWTGSMIDRLDLTHYAYLVVVGLTVGCLMLSSSESALTLFLSMLVLRHLGQGLMGMAGPTTMVRYLDHQKGKANALSGIGYSLSEAILPSIVIAQLAIMSWRQSWIAWAIILLVTVPLATRWLLRGHKIRHANYLQSVCVEQAEQPGAAQQRHWTRSEVVRDPLFYLFMPALLAQPMLFTGFMFHQVYLVEAKGWSLEIWASLYIVYALVSTVCKLGAGLLVDRYGAIRLVPFVCLPLGLGLLFLGSADSILVAALFMVLMAVSIGAYSTVSSPFYAEMYGSLHLGSIKSLATAAMVFSSAIAPVLMGWMIDAGVSIDTMALVSVAYVLLAFLSALWASALKRRTMDVSKT
jgi:MFS family permease